MVSFKKKIALGKKGKSVKGWIRQTRKRREETQPLAHRGGGILSLELKGGRIGILLHIVLTGGNKHFLRERKILPS